MIVLPECIESDIRGDEAALLLHIDAGGVWFQGHFDGHAILPGVVQIGWALQYAHRQFGFGPGLAAMEQVKFKRPIGPGQTLKLQLSRHPHGPRVRYEYRDAETSYSSGILSFA